MHRHRNHWRDRAPSRTSSRAVRRWSPAAVRYAVARGRLTAIDAGRDNGESRDQRGEGYARLLGIEADVGAVEWDPEGLEGDTIFANGFDLSSAD